MIRQLHSAPVLVRPCLKLFTVGFNIMRTKNFQMSKLGLEKAEEPEWIPNIHWIIEKAREFQKNTYFCFTNYTKAFDCVDHDKLSKALRETGTQTISPDSGEACMQVKKQQLETCMERLISSRSRNEYNRAVCCHPVCSTYTLSTSWEMPGWMSHKLESR